MADTVPQIRRLAAVVSLRMYPEPGEGEGRRPIGVRTELGLALVAQAVITIALAGWLVHGTADRQLREFGAQDLQQTADRLAVAAGFAYDGGRWSAERIRQLAEAERVEEHAVVVRDVRGRRVPGSASGAPPDSRQAAIMVGGRRVGTVVTGHARGGFLQVGQGGARRQLDRELELRLDRRLAEGALLAAAVALVLGLVLAFRLTRPLERLTAVARRMAHGEIETRAARAAGSRETQELGRTLDRLAAALRRQDELRRATIADVSHEMRNALVGVVGRLEALQDGIVADERTALVRIERDARRLHRLVDDVVALAEAQRPSLLVRKAPVDLGEIAGERVAAHADAFAERGIALRCRLRPACVEGDAERLVQIVDNLLSNALRYTDPGGRVEVRLDAHDGHVLLEVADTGIGIAPEHVGRVFDRFWRDPAARERVAEGSGVGLALVRDLVLAHDGRVEVESRPGEGTALRVVLPAVPEPELQVDGVQPLTLRTA